MTKKKSTKRALISSLLILAMCFTMLAGTTFAWFTDSVTSTGNKIVAGKLDIDLFLGTAADTYVEISDSSDPIFGSTSLIAQNNPQDTLWEPGKTQIAYLKLVNNGNLWLKYSVAIDVKNNVKDLYKVLKYVIIPDAKYGDVNKTAYDAVAANLASVNLGAQPTATDVEMAPGAEHYFALAVHMDEDAGNEYQEGSVDFDMTVLATQLNKEEDSFGPDYDKDALYPTQKVVTSTDELTAALADPEVTDIKLEGDVQTNDAWLRVRAGETKNIDLNGNTLEGNLWAYYTGVLTVSGGTVDGQLYVDDNAQVTIADDAIIAGDVVLDNDADKAAIDIYGKVNGYLWIMGNITDSASVINLYGEVNSPDDIGIALNGDATLNVYDGAKVKSALGTGIEVRAGNLNVYGGTIEGAGAFSCTPNGSGTTSTGCGIAVVQHTTKLPINVNITGGTITGSAYGLYENNIQGNDPYNNVSISYSGATITGGTANVQVL